MIKPKYNLMLKRGMCNYFKCHNNGHCTGCSMFTLLDTSSALNGLYVIKGGGIARRCTPANLRQTCPLYCLRHRLPDCLEKNNSQEYIRVHSELVSRRNNFGKQHAHIACLKFFGEKIQMKLPSPKGAYLKINLKKC